jgi:shikimate dehydrogenase
MRNQISGTTTLLGLFGSPVGHSTSPKMHNAAFEKLGLDYAYLAFDVTVETLPDAIRALKTFHMRGANVTMPCKTAAVQYMDDLTPAAQMAGAVNTIINDDGRLTGHITDGEGYMMSLKDAGYDPIGKKITLAGAGGAATAICVQAALDGVKEISIFNPKDEFFVRAEKIAKDIMQKTDCKVCVYDLADQDALRREISESYLFANSTRAGMKPLEDVSVITDVSMLRSDLIVTDVVYQPAKTKLLQMAESVGCPTLNGLGMILFQGAASFEKWTGKKMPVEEIKPILFG